MKKPAHPIPLCFPLFSPPRETRPRSYLNAPCLRLSPSVTLMIRRVITPSAYTVATTFSAPSAWIVG